MTEQRVLPMRLIRASTLESVQLKKVVAESRVRNADEIAKPYLNVGFGAVVGDKTASEFSVVVRGEVTIRDESVNNPESSVRVNAEFSLTYSYPTDLAPTSTELESFAETNAVLNAWPYLRELVQNVSSRMGLPPVTLPLFRVGEAGERAPKPVRSRGDATKGTRRRKGSTRP